MLAHPFQLRHSTWLDMARPNFRRANKSIGTAGGTRPRDIDGVFLVSHDGVELLLDHLVSS